jgi:hypothetical protein
LCVVAAGREMKIGIDFDNTIVCYDKVFYEIALEKLLVPKDTPANKSGVRNFLRNNNQEDIWTELQGYVYGARMLEADPFPGVREFFGECRRQDIAVFIISHRTRHPFVGELYDLHQSAYAWLKSYGFLGKDGGLLPSGSVYFELTKMAKLQRIDQTNCDYFIDDLPEFLSEAGFPSSTKKILFDPNGVYPEDSCIRATSWKKVHQLFF